jgi:hypothetical protein
MEATARTTILRIEIWHGALLLTLVAALWQSQFLDITALLAGGIFMGVNFLLLSYGVVWLLTPLAGSKRIKAGVGLLVVKIILFLALLSTLFFRFELDALSFAVGFSTLLVAIVIESLRGAIRVGA